MKYEKPVFDDLCSLEMRKLKILEEQRLEQLELFYNEGVVPDAKNAQSKWKIRALNGIDS